MTGTGGRNVALASADMDGDGDVDIVTAGTGGSRLNLFRNDTTTGSQHWLEVQVVHPVTGAVGGVGARVVVVTPHVTLFRDVSGGHSRASQPFHSARFGLGDWDGATTVVALFPDGSSAAAVNVPADQRITL